MALRKKTTRKKSKKSRKSRKSKKSRKSRSGGGMNMERIVYPYDYNIDPQNYYYLKLGHFQYYDNDDGYPVFEQNGQYYTINPQESIIFKANR